MSKYTSSKLALRHGWNECAHGGGKNHMAIMAVDGKLVLECKRRLLAVKMELLNRVKDTRRDLHFEDKGGDDADQTVRVLAEAETLTLHDRMRSQLLEIELALSRIDAGTYGICEETEETIEKDRLLAIPWTRLSIEGAEIRESITKRYARGS